MFKSYTDDGQAGFTILPTALLTTQMLARGQAENSPL